MPKLNRIDIDRIGKRVGRFESTHWRNEELIGFPRGGDIEKGKEYTGDRLKIRRRDGRAVTSGLGRAWN